jgi:hypothetical protein
MKRFTICFLRENIISIVRSTRIRPVNLQQEQQKLFIQSKALKRRDHEVDSYGGERFKD